MNELIYFRKGYGRMERDRQGVRDKYTKYRIYDGEEAMVFILLDVCFPSVLLAHLSQKANSTGRHPSSVCLHF